MDTISYLLIGGLVLLSICSVLMRVFDARRRQKEMLKEKEKKEEE